MPNQYKQFRDVRQLVEGNLLTKRYDEPTYLTFRAIFGEDFVIRKTQEVYLPIYNIAVQNPDGSILTTYWNGVNGQQVDTY